MTSSSEAQAGAQAARSRKEAETSSGPMARSVRMAPQDCRWGTEGGSESVRCILFYFQDFLGFMKTFLSFLPHSFSLSLSVRFILFLSPLLLLVWGSEQSQNRRALWCLIKTKSLGVLPL